MRLSIFWQSLLRWVALGGVLIALKVNPSSSVVQWTLWILVVVLVISAFFWPRCPHCGARVVQFNKREWIALDECWRCHRSYDEERTPPYVLEMIRTSEEAYRLRKKDPARSECLLAEAEERFQVGFEAEMAALRSRAVSDPSAARTLKVRLKTELDDLKKTRRHLLKGVKRDPALETGLQTVEARCAALEGELASIDALLPAISDRR
jgi:hypothetical protein